jgi:hypothetical protein
VLTLPELRRINSVHVMGKSGCDSKENNLRFPLYGRGRFQAVTRSEAVLDGFVYGFHTHPEGAINIPMLPAALHERSWRAQVESAVDPSFATPTDGPLPYGDFIVHLGAVPHDPEARLPGVYAPILRIGTSNAAEALTQFDAKNPGITPRQYGVYLAASAQKPFALDTKTFRLAAPGSPLVSPDDLALLETNLQGLVNRRLIWPLYAEYDESQGSGRVMITGFVAARIVDVRKTSYHVMVDPNGKGKGKHKGLCHEHPPGFAFGKDKGKGEEKSQDAKGKKKGLNDDQGHNGWNVDPPEGKAYGKKGLCVEFGALQITLRPTMLATSTGMVFVSDWPSGPQHLFRFPNAYIKRIRLVK